MNITASEKKVNCLGTDNEPVHRGLGAHFVAGIEKVLAFLSYVGTVPKFWPRKVVLGALLPPLTREFINFSKFLQFFALFSTTCKLGHISLFTLEFT